MKTTVINIFGSPGSGKSTLAAELYAEMKKQGKSVELVREAIKPWAYEGKKPTVFEQIYITNKQMLEETSLYGKVKYVITDSPISLGSFYLNWYHSSDMLQFFADDIEMEARLSLRFEKNINLFVPFNQFEYNNEGRYSSSSESKQIEESLRSSPPAVDLHELSDSKTRCQDALKIILP